MMNNQEANTVVIVGGGPIGLANAIGIKMLNPELDVVVLEKYEEYQRKHTLILKHDKLKLLMDAMGASSDPTFMALHKRLQKDPHIRTNELEDTFKQFAKAKGVQIEIGEVKAESIQEQLHKYGKPIMIIGADGTHSVVSNTLFPEGNQVKYEFDFVLQMRYDIIGNEQAGSAKTAQFYQNLARLGVIANEYVGHHKDGKTPVTMQMMISKAEFDALKDIATSKNPLTPYTPGGVMPANPLPERLNNFLTRYLKQRLEICKKADVSCKVDSTGIRVSVNEAPATHAKQVYRFLDVDVPVVLMGDASLGLSYFKGLNAGFEATARFLSHLAPTFKKQESTENTKKALVGYAAWFLTDFAPKKVKEVADYSAKEIHRPEKVVKVTRDLKQFSTPEHETDRDFLIRSYFEWHQNDPTAEERLKQLHPRAHFLYPHRKYDPEINIGQFKPVPLRHTLRKIVKLFVDFFKPYKSLHHFKQDLRQPLTASSNLGSGFLKFCSGIYNRNGRRVLDGSFTFIRGLFELATWPLAWTLKPLLRGFITLVRGRPKVEENDGIQVVAEGGVKGLVGLSSHGGTTADLLLTPSKLFELRARVHDIHRKVDKCILRGQLLTEQGLKERPLFNEIQRADALVQPDLMRQYFTLFARPERVKPAPSLTGRANTREMWRSASV